MKRSEMLKIIEKALGTNPNEWPRDVLAENILCSIEEAGMSPPIANSGCETRYGELILRMWEEEYDLMHKMEVETRYLDCDCKLCKEAGK